MIFLISTAVTGRHTIVMHTLQPTVFTSENKGIINMHSQETMCDLRKILHYSYMRYNVPRWIDSKYDHRILYFTPLAHK